MTDDVYEVYAIKYGRHERNSSANFIGGDSHDVPMPLDYFVWAIVGANRTFILDTGFDQKAAQKRDRMIDKPVGDGLRALGIDPASVKDVIISHLHFDHAGNDGLFPNARFHLQDCEMDYATGRCMCHGMMRFPFEATDVTAMVQRVFEDRVVFHDGAEELAPGLSVHLIGGHSKGLQAVRVKTRRGWMVLASDVAHFYAHLQQRRVFPITYHVGDVLAGYDKVEALASSKHHVVPGHDPLVLELYPPARPNMEGWAARLDADPKPLPTATAT
ncbi:MAG: N-acyl homoserine lactonase family protein [Pseudolabrys sp.]|nr:N-acyl homoserine lactonase family protein [Pseudolabrys sp.]MDP2297157.1 N-acyl homoserine lactonase family protein [Pseudolabrys sp.]